MEKQIDAVTIGDALQEIFFCDIEHRFILAVNNLYSQTPPKRLKMTVYSLSSAVIMAAGWWSIKGYEDDLRELYWLLKKRGF